MNRPFASFETHDEDGDPHPSSGATIGRDVNEMAEESFRGQSVRSLPRANKRYQADRTCAAPGCRTKLSIYNKWEYCWQHEPVHTYIARGKRRSRKEMEAA
jgi:hypothetical protein